MTVFKHPNGKSWHYDFWYLGQRRQGPTQQTVRSKALRVEHKVREQLRERAGGIADPTTESPRFQDWAEVYLDYKTVDGPGQVARPDHIKFVLLPLMRFWGAPDAGEVRSDDTPFHDLRLVDPIHDPQWILQFERWLTARGIAGQTRNHYRSVMSRMYRVALLPQYRQVTGVAFDPFAGLPRDQATGRTVTLTPAQVRRWASKASYHVRVAIAIAALAPKLRLANVLKLRWDQIDEGYHYLTIAKHKTSRRTRQPMVSPISGQLRAILKDAKRRAPKSLYVVSYRGQPVTSIRDGVIAAAKEAEIPYGRDTEDGATFHTLRHSASTLMGEGERDPFRLRDAMGHGDMATTLKYTHLRPSKQKAPLERLSKMLKLQDVVTGRRRRALRKTS